MDPVTLTIALLGLIGTGVGTYYTYKSYRRSHSPKPTGGVQVPPAQSASLESPGTQGVVHNLPFARNGIFTGRKRILKQIEKSFGGKGAVAITQPHAIHGLGGIGKTQIAMEYAYQHLSEYRYVFWLGAETEATLFKSLGEVAAILHLPQRQEKKKAVLVEAVRSWFESHDSWLLIFDNAENAASVQSYLPRTDAGRVIITTRAPAMSGLASAVEVDELDPESAVKFLFKRAAIEKPDSGQTDVAGEICYLFGYMPLAIDHAGAYLEETRCSLESYKKYLDQHGVKILRGEKYTSAMYGKTVEATWAISIEKLNETNPSAVALLTSASYLAPDDIPIGLFKADQEALPDSLKVLVADEPLFDQALGDLQRFSLIRRQQGADTFSMHRLVQSVIRDSQNDEEGTKWLNSMLGCLKAHIPDVEDYRNWPVLEGLSSHAASLFAEADKLNLQTATLSWLLVAFAYYLDDRADYATAEPLNKRALKITESTLGPDHPDVAVRLNNLALLYHSQGRYADAEPLYQRALAIDEKALGPDHPDVARGLNNLAALYRNQVRYDEAEPLYQRALKISEKALSSDHPNVATGLNNLAELYRSLERYGEAEPLYRRALKIDEKALGPDHPNVAIDLNNLGLLYDNQGRYGETEPLYLRALKICQSALGETHPTTVTVLENLAVFYNKWGKKDKAAEYALLAQKAKTEE